MKKTGREGGGRRLSDKRERGQEEERDEGRRIGCKEDRQRRERYARLNVIKRPVVEVYMKKPANSWM